MDYGVFLSSPAKTEIKITLTAWASDRKLRNWEGQFIYMAEKLNVPIIHCNVVFRGPLNITLH